MRRPPKPSVAGFSLIELIIVLVILAVMAAMAAFSTRGAAARSRMARGVEVVEQFDLALRRAARHNRSNVSANIDRSRGRLLINLDGNARSFRIPDRVRIGSVRIRGGSSSGRLIARGDGATETYAVEIESDGASAWVLFVGGSGQVIRCNDGKHAARLLGAVR